MWPPAPADLFGPLLAEVQRRRLYGDGKTFVDAIPLRPAGEIMAMYARIGPDDAAIRAFVDENFRMPAHAATAPAHHEPDLRRAIASLWPELTRLPCPDAQQGSSLPLDRAYLVPGGRFGELYYWDSYFSQLGLIRDGYEPLARAMLDTFTDLIEHYGHIPNGTRSYYLSRSQPPLYFAMVRLLPEAGPEANRRRLRAMRIEHEFWMAGADALRPGDRSRRVVAMPDGAVLNRYWDDRDTPRDESFAEDTETAHASSSPPDRVLRALRAGAESGWDFSSRWLAPGGALASIRTPEIIPIDLNAYLYGLEQTIAEFAAALCDDATARDYAAAAQARQAAIDRWLWCAEGYFTDFDLALDAQRQGPTAATLAPLFTGLASAAQAQQVADTVARQLLARGGLRTTLIETGEQWDWPNGWAPLQWIAFSGLRRYGHHDLADTIARRWTAMVDAEFQRSGHIHEKYNVERACGGGGGEYPPQLGFGWTNGVTATFIDLLAGA